MKIKLDIKESVFTAPFFKYNFGLSYCKSGQDATITDDLDNLPESPFIFFDDRECASLKSRDVFELDNFLGVLKFEKYDSLKVYNSQMLGVHSSAHESMIFNSNRSFFQDELKKPSLLRPFDLEKIHVGWSYVLFHQRLDNVHYVDSRKDIDCFFGGSIGFSSLPLTYHRVQAVKAMHELTCNKLCYHYWTPCDLHKSCFTDLKPSASGRPCPKVYLDLLKRSKIALSPWGNGESCFRDFEAALSGCVIIKPDGSHTSSYPNLKYVSCELDFSDLQEKVDVVLDNWSYYQQLVFENIEIINSARTQMPDRFNLLVENILQ